MNTEVRVIEVTSADQAADILRDALEGSFLPDESILFKFAGWPNFNVNVEGERYHQTVPTQLMKALVEYQHVINQIYANSVYDSTSKAFTDEERFSNELVFRVEEGSSDLFASLADNINGLAGRLVEKMTGKQLVVTVLGLALLASGYFGYKQLLEHESQGAAEANRHALEMRLLEESAASRRANEALSQNVVSIIKAVPDAAKVSVGSQKFDKTDVDNLNRKSRDSWDRRRMDSMYDVVSLKRLKDRWSIQLEEIDSGRLIRTELFKGESGIAAIGEISKAFADSKPLKLYVIAKVRGDQVSQARILGTEQTGLGVAHGGAKLDPSDDLALHE